MIHEAHWKRLSSLAPDDVCRRSGAQYDPASGHYILTLLDRQVSVDPAERTVRWGGEPRQADQEPGYNVALLAVVYLIEAKDMHPAGEWATAESLPAGTFFFRGLHVIPTAELASRFGDDRDGFLNAGGRLGGRSVEWGDACVQIQVLPRIAVRLVLWQGDDEFPARVTMLFDRLVDQHVPLDVLHSMARHVTSAMLQTASDCHDPQARAAEE